MSEQNVKPPLRLARRLDGLPPSLYARVMARLSSYGGEVYPFHIGETWLLPTKALQEALLSADDRALHRYGHPQGLLSLRETIVAQTDLAAQHVSPEQVIVTHGATHGLHLACQAVLDPGDEVMVLSPHWPLFNNMVHTAGAIPVEVPFTCQLRKEDDCDVEALLRGYVSEKTRALYVTTPNNPCGTVLKPQERLAIARFAEQHQLFVFADEAYEKFHFDTPPAPMRSLPGMAERTISIYTFSKSHRMAGLRVGYCIAPPDVLGAMIKLANISVYNVSLLMQRAAQIALEQGQADVAETVAAAGTGAQLLTNEFEKLPGLQFHRAEGGAYLFVDLSDVLQGRDCFDLLDTCLDRGIVFSPGVGFGKDYSAWGRFCFTAMAPEHLMRGTERLAEIIRSF